MDMDPENAAINSRASKDAEHFPLLVNEDEPKPKKKGFFRIDPNETPILIAFGFEFIGTVRFDQSPALHSESLLDFPSLFWFMWDVEPSSQICQLLQWLVLPLQQSFLD